MLIFILGGARSGKSTLALDLAQRWERSSQQSAGVTMVATAPEIPGDEDLAARIRTHQNERPAHWATVEEPTDLLGALARPQTPSDGHCVIIDCLTLWVNNLLWRGDTPEQIISIATRTAQAAATRHSPTVVVSNEVGLGIHPASPEGREFRDLLGRVNSLWATQADHNFFLVAGQILHLSDPSDSVANLFAAPKEL
jgi:adenosylcobinamide kinase / adenosylcobinamide-phosphate guanylyltransferase